MIALVTAGEMIFSLPYHLTRYFRPTVREVFNFSNTDLGDIFVPYGIIAMLAYFPGGILADRFPPRKLMTFALVATGLGGFYFVTLPGVVGTSVLYAYWGVTSILPFWCALIRATRMWGGQFAQGRGFGFLDGGRGLLAATCASLAVFLFSASIGTDPTAATPGERAQAFQLVVLFYSALTMAAGIVVWLYIPDPPATEKTEKRTDPTAWSDVRAVLGNRTVWLQAIIVVSAYCGYKGLDNYSVYAYDALGMNETSAARFTATFGYIRPAAAIVAGFLGDRFGIAKVIALLFASLAASYTMLAFLDASPTLLLLVYANLLISAFGVYALRGLYFALLEQTRVPDSLTGAAVGLISVVGYTPDIFFYPIAGRLLDAAPGIAGHQNSFLFLSGIAAAGLAVTVFLQRGIHRKAVTGTGGGIARA